MPEKPDWTSTPDAERDLILDVRSMRTIAHPVRIKILGALRAHGPQTSTTLAARLGLNSGATSYHLRQLAERELINEAPELGTGRERWWRVPTRSTWLDRANLDEEGREASDAYLRAIGLFYGEHLQRAIEESVAQPEPWRSATEFSDFLFRLSPEEASRLLAELHEVLGRYRSYDDPDAATQPEAELFTIQLQAFRSPGA